MIDVSTPRSSLTTVPDSCCQLEVQPYHLHKAWNKTNRLMDWDYLKDIIQPTIIPSMAKNRKTNATNQEMLQHQKMIHGDSGSFVHFHAQSWRIMHHHLLALRRECRNHPCRMTINIHHNSFIPAEEHGGSREESSLKHFCVREVAAHGKYETINSMQHHPKHTANSWIEYWNILKSKRGSPEKPRVTQKILGVHHIHAWMVHHGIEAVLRGMTRSHHEGGHIQLQGKPYEGIDLFSFTCQGDLG